MKFRIGTFLAALLVCQLAQAQAPTGAPVAAAASPAPATAPNPAGRIDLAEGDSKIVSAGAAARIAKVGDVVREGDMLVTGKDGEVHLTMQDTGFIALRPSTQFRIVAYKADGDADDKGVFRLLAGGFRSVTGWIGKYNPRGYRVQTPTATIGIRGTDHEPRYVPEGSMEGEPGTYDKVYVGQTSIENAAGTTAVAPNQAGFVSIKPRDRPRVLANVPRFFVPSRYEAAIAKKHAEVQKMIQERREERRKVIREMRAETVKARQDAKSQLEHNKAAKGERQEAAQERRDGNADKRKAIQSEAQDALQKRRQLEDKRAALQNDIKSGKLTQEQIRARRQELLNDTKSLQAESKDVKQKHEALKDDNKAALKDRVDAAKDDRKALQEKARDAKGKAQALEQEREATKAEISGMRKKEQQRYREELKAARKKAAE